MGLLSGTKEFKHLKLCSYKDGKIIKEFILDKRKCLIGSAPSCDIIIDDPSISHYHAMVFLDEDGGKVVDLESTNGLFLNQDEVKEGFFLAGDHLILGTVEFYVEETIVDLTHDQGKIQDQDLGKVKKVNKEEITSTLIELPPLPGLTLIDGEYCDIKFTEEEFIPVKTPPALSLVYSKKDYIDFDEDQELVPILNNKKGESIEVTVLCSGNILSVDFFPMKNRTYYASASHHGPKSVLVPNLDSSESNPFVSVKGDQIVVYPLKGFESINNNVFGESGGLALAPKSEINLAYQTTQVLVRRVPSPPSLAPTPFFGRDREFKKHTAKVFSSIMSIMLLLLFVDVQPEPEKEEKIAVIYKRAIKAPNQSNEKTAENVAKKEQDLGVRPEPTPKQETQMAKAPPKDAPKVNKATEKKVAQTQPKNTPQPSKLAPKVAEIKTYKFTMNNSVKAFLGSKSPQNLGDFKQSSPTATPTFQAADVASSSSSPIKSASTGNVGNLAKDFKGQYDASTGTAGLASKSGIDTAYVDPNTVVLGSMDPELLRKILQEYRDQFRHCYQNEIDRHSSLVKGVIDLKFRINGNGRVSNVQVLSRGAKFSEQGTDCMAKVLRGIDFPKPKGGGVVDVKQPLNFRSERSSI